MTTPSEVSIRLGEATDLPDVSRIVAAAYNKYTAKIGKPPAPMLDDYAAHVRNGTIWVAETAGTVAGLIVLLPETDHLLLDNIAVDPQRQGRGIGRGLMAFAEREATRRSYPILRLYTHVTMTENIALYNALGWQERGRGEQAGYQRVFFEKSV
jgi:ribosomal protein S18 acetylase RimI-like enzyme